jgi:A/G-specific adenine glycosylase
MLQQTSVATTIPYFERFIAAFPTVRALAQASLEEVLCLWQGLGYYARARRLLQTAQILESQGGHFPTTLQDLLKLPGIGRYTATAIASMAFGEPVLARDTNVTRLVLRLFSLTDPTCIEAQVSPLLHPHPGDTNQAFMDIGALYCRAHRASCPACPLSPFCRTSQENAGEILFAAPPKEQKPTRYATFFHISAEGCLLLEQRPPQGLLGGLYGLPTTAWDSEQEQAVVFPEALRLIPQWQESAQFSHTFTHFRLHVHVLQAQLPRCVPFACPSWIWVPYAQLAHYALPTLFRKALRG